MMIAVAEGSERARLAGRLIVVLGPSGAGKDTLMSIARTAYDGREDVLFVRRVITRPADPGSEGHEPMSEDAFDAALDEGRFSLTWAANGLRYGLPREIETHLSAGNVAVVNGSRGAWSVIREVFPGSVSVEVRVDADTLARRLQARGRESRREIEARLKRAAALQDRFLADHVIDNSGDAQIAGAELATLIGKLLAGKSLVE